MCRNVHPLGYSVVFCSGWEAEHSGDQLHRCNSQPVGWQSARSCKYPQSVVLELNQECNVRQVKILNHEYKIARRIELFMGGEAREWTETRFWRLGYVSLDPNQRSRYQFRELKSVFVSSKGSYIKLVMHGCHENCENLFKQVGLVAVSILGEPLQSAPLKAPAPLEEFCRAKMVAHCVETCEHSSFGVHLQLASRLKMRDPQLCAYGVQLTQVEAAKEIAVKNEDYDRFKPMMQKRNYAVSVARAGMDKDMGLQPNHLHQAERSEHAGTVQEVEQKEQQQTDNRSSAKMAASQFEGVPHRSELPEPEPLKRFQAVQTADLVSLVGEYHARCLLSKRWPLRAAALSKLRIMLQAGGLGDIAADRLCAVAKIGIEDKISQVYFAGVELLLTCGEQRASRTALEPGVISLFEKLADNLQRVRDKAAGALVAFAPWLGAAFLANLLLQSLDRHKHLNHKKWRPIATRLALLKLLDPSQLPVHTILNFLCAHDCAGHTSASVRQLTRGLVAHLAPALPDPCILHHFFKRLRPKQREDYLQAIRDAEPTPKTFADEQPEIADTAGCHTLSATPTHRHFKAHRTVEIMSFRDLIMTQLEEEAFSVEKAYDILKWHFGKANSRHLDTLKASVLREWCAEIGTSDAGLDSLHDQGTRDLLLKQVATWLFH